MRKHRTTRAVLTPGEVVKELRVKKGWSQALLAEVTDMAVPNLSNIERGRSRLGEDRAILLAVNQRGRSPLFDNFCWATLRSEC